MKAKKKLVDRSVIGFGVLTGRAPPSAHLIYRLHWSDGTVTQERGQSLQTLPGFEHLNGTSKQKAKAARNLRTDLYEPISAIAILLAPIERACWELDKEMWK